MAFRVDIDLATVKPAVNWGTFGVSDWPIVWSLGSLERSWLKVLCKTEKEKLLVNSRGKRKILVFRADTWTFAESVWAHSFVFLNIVHVQYALAHSFLCCMLFCLFVCLFASVYERKCFLCLCQFTTLWIVAFIKRRVVGVDTMLVQYPPMVMSASSTRRVCKEHTVKYTKIGAEVIKKYPTRQDQQMHSSSF